METNYTDVIDVFKQMSDSQSYLNSVIGIPLNNFEYQTCFWLYSLSNALSDEISEAKNCINWKWWSKEGKVSPFSKFIDYKNLQIELVDCLHFILCFQHISNFQLIDMSLITNKTRIKIDSHILDKFKNNPWSIYCYLDFFEEYVYSFKFELLNRDFVYCSIGDYSIDKLDLLKNTKISEDQGLVNSSITFCQNIFNYFYTIVYLLDLNINHIYSIYNLKNKVNLDRQYNDYSIINKTEDDNNSIKEKIDSLD